MILTIEIPAGDTLTGTKQALRHVLTAAVESLTVTERKAQAASERAMDARGALPPGSSRARVTTANARWASAAEHRDRVRDALHLAQAMLASVQP